MKLDCREFVAENCLSTEDFQKLLSNQGFWFHNFEFTNGCSTHGSDPSSRKLTALGLPNVEGKSVIDIGAFDGYFSLQAEALGANRVVACDHIAWTWPGSVAKSNIELVERICRSKVENVTCSVEETSAATLGKFDVALFLGVLYHASDMVGYLSRVRAITKEIAVIETLVDRLDIGEPSAAFYPGNSLNNDGSNWWGPNIPCVLGMLEKVGFKQAKFISLWDVNPIEKIRGASETEALSRPLRNGRAVFHAYA